MKFLEQRPILEHFDRLAATSPTWVATVAGERLCLDDQGVQDQVLKVVQKEHVTKDPLIKFLMVASPCGTQAFATWTRGPQNSTAKIFFEKVFEPFGDAVMRKALGDMHVMSTRHELQIKKWILKCELEKDQDEAALLEIEEFSDEKMKAKFLEIVRQQISDRKACEDRRALCDGREDSDDDADQRQETFAEEYLKQYVVELANVGCNAKLFVVNTKPESEREGAVRDSLPIDMPQKVLTLERLEREGKDTHNVKLDILQTVVKTNYDLAQTDVLPNLDDRNAKASFLKRAINVTKHIIGEAPDKKAVEGQLAKLRSQEKFKCTQCAKKAQHVRHYRVIPTGICYPIASLASEPAKDLAIFCSPRCQQKWDETLMCPKCKTFDWKRDVEGKAPYPDPFKMLDNLVQYQYCRTNVPGTPVCPITRIEPRMIVLPLCTTCSSVMMPRTPGAPHLHLAFSHDDVPRKRL